MTMEQLLLSEREVICSFMEPKPDLPPHWGCWPTHRWWVLVTIDGGGMAWRPREITLNECHEVEARLTDEQWGAYERALGEILWRLDFLGTRDTIHADATQKIAALVKAIPGGQG